MQQIYYTHMSSPVGRLLLAGHDGALKRIGFPKDKGAEGLGADWVCSMAPFGEAIRQLQAYFHGKLRRFNLPLVPEGTPFQLAVWDKLLEIPYGITVTYLEIARRMGNPRAVRAVGAACGRNPLPIVIPCHRVVGSDGRLTGYAGGQHVKEALLLLEGRG